VCNYCALCALICGGQPICSTAKEIWPNDDPHLILFARSGVVLDRRIAMEEAELYHRTFLRYQFDPKAGHYRCATGSCHDEIRKAKQHPFEAEPEFLSREPKPTMPIQPFGQVFRTVRTSEPPAQKQQPLHPNQRRFSALKMTEDGQTESITIIEKPDQRFIDYASQWELRWSAITQHGGRLQPVVDHNLTVIGHYGLVNGAELIRPEDGGLHYLSELLEAEIPVFLVNDPMIGVKKPVQGAPPIKPPDGWTELGLLRDQYLVIAAPDGQVVLGVLHKQGHSAQSMSTVVALVVGEIVGRLGVKVLASAFGLLMKKLASGVRWLGRPTRILAEKFASKLKRLRDKKKALGGKTLLADGDGVLAVIMNGQIVARAWATGSLSHEKFVMNELGKKAVVKTPNGVRLAPQYEGAEVVTIGKIGSDVGALRSRTFHHNELPASQAAQDAARNEYAAR
jgi:hypothetical protein